jgi:glutaredoxin
VSDEHRPIVILYFSQNCPYSKKVLAYIEEQGLEVPLKNVDEDPKASEELLHLGGKTQTPCLFIEGKPLYESQDIIDWLSDKKDLFE